MSKIYYHFCAMSQEHAGQLRYFDGIADMTIPMHEVKNGYDALKKTIRKNAKWKKDSIVILLSPTVIG